MKAALNVRGVDFAVMPTRDFDTAAKFYGDTLGLRRSVYVPDRKSRARLEESGVTFIGDIIDSGVCYQAIFSDPDGNTLILHHRYA